MFVKVCGLSTPADVDAAVAAGADAVGFVVYPPSPRHVDPAGLAALVARVPDGVRSVVVVADLPAGEAAAVTADAGADVLQLHGRYTAGDFAVAGRHPVTLWRATSLADDPDLTVGLHGEDVLLLDSPSPGPASGGTPRHSTRSRTGAGCSRAAWTPARSDRRCAGCGPGASTSPAASSPPAG